MSATPTAEHPTHRRVRAWWADAVLLACATLLAELALHESVVMSPAPIPAALRGFIDAVGLVLIVSPLFAWTLYRRTVDAKYARVHTEQLKAPGSPHHRVRVAVLGSLSVFAVIVAGALWGNVAASRTLARQGEVIEALSRQRLHGERIERLANSAIDNVIDEALLADEVSRLRLDAERLQTLLASLDFRQLRSNATLDSLLRAAQSIEDALVQAAQRLPQTIPEERARTLSAVLRSASDYQSNAGRALTALQELQNESIGYTETAAWSSGALAFAVLLGIALLVIEPVVRLLRRQHAAVTSRSLEFERLAMVAQRTSNAVVITDANRKVTWANEGFTRLTGWELHEVMGKNPGAFLQSDVTDREAVRRMRHALDAGAPVRATVLNTRKCGEHYWNDLNIEPLRENGVLTGFIAVQSNITEQINAREALQQEREALARTTAQLEEAQKLARIGNWEFDMTTGIIEWSPGTYSLFGLDPERGSLSIDEVRAGYEPADRARLSEAIGRASRTGEPYSLVLRTAGRNPAVRWVRADGRARRGPDGRIVGLYGTATDMTEAVEREEALRHAQERAEAANRSKSEFLANMSHEIRTPLTAILGYTELLRDEAAKDGATSGQLQAMETIQRAGEHLLTVINDILDISKIEAGKLQIERLSTPLPSVLLDVESLMRARAQAKGVSLENRLVSSVPDRIVTDPTRLRQILMNLVGNAAKFTDRGRILVETGVVLERGTETLVIAVDDTGPGISEEQAAQLFQPFTQADNSVTRKHGGTGLGLTICRRLAELMGGNVELVSTALGRGSRFELRLPLQAADNARKIERLDPAATSTTSDQRHPRALTDRRILVAEDGEDNQRLITVLLRAAGADVTVVANGRKALDALSWAEAGGSPFDLLLTDMQMPEMDGYTLASTLRAGGSTIPIVALTAHAMADDRQKCLDAGCDDYATKPIDRQALIATCARWVSSMELFAPARALTTAEHRAVEAVRSGDVPVLVVSEIADDPELAELALGFARALPARVASITAAVEGGEGPAAARLTHQLKGAAGSYGYPEISELARQLEQALLSGDKETERLLARLASYAESARRAAPADIVGAA